ncbi:ABC transporter permease [Mesomycoplasma ovipneumoniae]|uniref:Oligopeptide ABC transporter system, permease protein (OppC) n=1 Tax=Mesomycoplasma ovipneumoniae 14811 TaxID=1188239 RepID=A0A014KVS8_9BACT|nr:ABC transporter permease [Mesomycoplasma ovipneumoniae]EXU61111.1 Oligopeptide ABC transporter system, permease protein (OppC) [Mesomycoplasma ovipneumoniae 14811]MDW2931083.1 ABC transporter permease [Mesomycoplasma ovipneumoniae]MDW2933256.1 ABC transporter permease [Mesomycoplasma ovipneumoniae]WNM16081.1 ABC transporter permease [Mesomycoplasma ovipneumoniae]
MLDPKEFNQKYNLKENQIKLLKLASFSEKNYQVTGKIVELWKDTVQKFFKSKISLISTLLFLSVLIIAIFTIIFSPYSVNKPISNADPSLVYEQLPSTLGTIKTTISTDILEKIRAIEVEKNITLIQGSTKELFPNRWEINVNPYQVMSALENGKNFISLVGTDQFGRDIWLRTWQGTLNALGISVLIALIQFLIGIVLGTYLGYHIGSWIDNIVLRIIDIFGAIPWIIIFIIFIAIWGPYTITIIILLSLTGWTIPTYQARSYTVIVKDEEYIYAAKVIGASKFRQIYSHILPNILGKLLSTFIASIFSSISTIASLAFLGFLQEGPESSANLGLIINSSVPLADKNPIALLLPSMVLVALAVTSRFIANGIHDALDPRVGGRK